MIATEFRTWCQLCGLVTKTSGGLVSHLTLGHRVSQQWYYETYFDNPCEQCGKQIPFGRGVFHRFSYVSKRRFCSLRCKGDHVIANGRGRPNHDGYILSHVRRFPKKYWPILMPMRLGKTTREAKITEHRAAMAIKLGRPLRRSETVHHRNGIRADNRIANLELFALTHGPGVRAKTLVCPHCGKSYA